MCHADHRTRQVGQKISRQCLVVARQPRNCDVIDILHLHAAGAQTDLRREPSVSARIGIATAEFATSFECVFACCPTERIAITVQRTVCATSAATPGGPVDDVARKQRRDHFDRNPVVLGEETECLFSFFAGFACLVLLTAVFSTEIKRRPTRFDIRLFADAQFVHDGRRKRGHERYG